ncbi:dihydropyrimidinase [Zhaonella formicivorans]|uniref:dihydropyrimidinase n=1 Tax=Zhaonella formicivorans TaxID=2528593 RepID=UPI001D0F51FB|nr:dihydropyrimidinase [Zhaonella formicivorans]
MALIIKNGSVVTEQGVVNKDLKVENEKIAVIADNIEASVSDEVIDARGKLVLPGVIDAHVHFNMPAGNTVTADNFESGTTSAACGGVTTFIDYAELVEGKTLLESLKIREAQAIGHSFIDYNLHLEIPGQCDFSLLDELEEIKAYGVKSLKVYTTYAMQLPDAKIKELLKKAGKLGMLVTIHAEDNDIVLAMKEEFLAKGKTSPAYHAASRPHIVETNCIEKMIAYAREAEAPVYFVHVSTGEGARKIKKAQEEGQVVYGETCPHYLVLTDECYERPQAQKYIMTPPLRKKEDQDLLWEGLANGTFQCITTDHCAFSLEQKLASDSCFNSLAGIPGTETLLPLVYSEGVAKGRITLEQMVSLLATNPAKIFGLYPQKGVIAEGSDADLTLLDPEKEVTLTGEALHSASGYTPFEGMRVKGYPILTILRGKVLYQDGKFVAEAPEGRFVKAVSK